MRFISITIITLIASCSSFPFHQEKEGFEIRKIGNFEPSDNSVCISLVDRNFKNYSIVGYCTVRRKLNQLLPNYTFLEYVPLKENDVEIKGVPKFLVEAYDHAKKLALEDGGDSIYIRDSTIENNKLNIVMTAKGNMMMYEFVLLRKDNRK